MPEKNINSMSLQPTTITSVPISDYVFAKMWSWQKWVQKIIIPVAGRLFVEVAFSLSASL
jgi:hypothetical protein